MDEDENYIHGFDFGDADDEEEVVKVKAKRVRKVKAVVVDGEASAEPTNLRKVSEHLEDLRAKGTHLFRYITMRGDKVIKKEPDEVCSARLKYGPKGGYNNSNPAGWKGATLGLVFNGESPKDTSAPSGMLKGGETSLAWLKFLLDENESPWAEVIPSITNRQDVEWINEKGGLILENFHEVGGNVFGGFIIATRYAQEHNTRASHWFDLVKGGMNPRLAYIMVSTCNKGGARVSNCGHMPISSPSELWMKACWERKGNLGNPVGEAVFSGGDPLYNNTNSEAYKAYYGYDRAARDKNAIKFGNFDEVLAQVKERIGYVDV